MTMSYASIRPACFLTGRTVVRTIRRSGPWLLERTPVTAAIRARAQRRPDELALVDDSESRTWAQVSADMQRTAAALLAAAPGPAHRVSVLGENANPTLIAHAAALTVGVGTVATSRQLQSNEMIDQYADAGVVCVITGAASLRAVQQAASTAGLQSVVVHGSEPPQGAASWREWLDSAPALPPNADQRPPRPLLVYTSGTTGRARGAEVRWTLGLPQTAADYVAAITEESAFPPGPHLVVGPLQHNAPLTSVRHLLGGEPVVILGRFDAETVLKLIQKYRIVSSVMVPTHLQRLLALEPEVRARYDVSSLQMISQTGSACPADVKRAMIDWFGPIFVESYGGTESGTLCRIDST